MKYVIITDHIVLNLYGMEIYCQYKKEGKSVALLSVPSGETSKTRRVKENLENYLFFLGYGRDTTIVALGGGVITDLSGFLASTFCRGVFLILIPTTVIGMVDAAIGGKTGINGPRGKNMIGTFHNATEVVIDYKFLQTLPEKEWMGGRVEMLKAALVWDRDFFANFSTFSNFQAIQKARAIKESIVIQDPYDKTIRKILNFGHTLAHAFEALSDFQISHGEAVAMGIFLESRISYEMGILSQKDFLLIQAKFPPIAIDFSSEEILRMIRMDKKHRNDSFYFILLQEIGSAVEECVPEFIIRKVLDDARVRSCTNI